MKLADGAGYLINWVYLGACFTLLIIVTLVNVGIRDQTIVSRRKDLRIVLVHSLSHQSQYVH